MSNKKRKQEYLRKRRTARPWPILIVSGGLALIALAAVAVWRGQANPKPVPEITGAPRLKADREQVDLGDIQLGKTVEVAFQLTNVGDRPLRFTDTPYVEVVEGC